MQSFRQFRRLRETVKTGHSQRPADQDVEPNAPIGGAQTIPGQGESLSEKHILVEWDGPDDPLNPRNWSHGRRFAAFCIVWINVFALDYASGADSQASSRISKAFHVGEEAETLSPTLYTFGIALGSLFAGPISETVGRNPVYVVSRILHVAWLLGAALSPNFGAQCAFRFLAGLGGSTLLCIHGASVADMYNPIERTWAWPLMSLASFAGTALTPTISAWIAQASITWRMDDWVALIISGATLFLSVFLMPETFSPVLLSWKAKHLRETTGNPNYVSYQDLQPSLGARLKTALLRAWHMLVKEPIVVLMGLWLIAVYIVVYGFLQGFSFIFGDTYDLATGLKGTCFLAIVVGFVLWLCLVPIYYRLYKKEVLRLEHENGDDYIPDLKHVPGYDIPEPEYRIWPAVIVAPAFPICLFWLGYTNRPDISIWSSLGAVTLFGFCWAGIYVVVYNYILDVCTFITSLNQCP